MNNLTQFMYLLMRDHLPTGVVCGIIQEIEEDNSEPVFSNKYLEEMSKSYLERLKEK